MNIHIFCRLNLWGLARRKAGAGTSSCYEAIASRIPLHPRKQIYSYLKKIGRDIPADDAEGQRLFLCQRPGNFTGCHAEDGASHHGYAQQNKRVGHADGHQAVQGPRPIRRLMMQ